jgi:hypothetical protein
MSVEVHEEPATGRRSNRGFWLVAGALGLGCALILVEVFANFGVKDTIAHAQHSLRTAQAAAEEIRDRDGSLQSATAERLSSVGGSVGYVEGMTAARGLDQVSVTAGHSDWAAAVEVRSGVCFYLHLTSDGEVLYGVGTVCTGAEALQARDARW